MLCEYCGKEVNEKALFCKYCGNQISVNEVISSNEDVKECDKSEMIDDNSKISRRSKVIIALIVVLSSIVIVIELLVGFGVIGHTSLDLYRDIIKKTNKIAYTLTDNGYSTRYVIENDPSSDLCIATSLSRNTSKGNYSNSVITNYKTEISQETFLSIKKHLSEAKLNDGQLLFESLRSDDGELMVDIYDIEDSVVEIYMTVERTSSGTSILEDGIKLSLKVDADEVSGECSETYSFTEDGLYSVDRAFKELDESVRRGNDY